MIHALNFTRKYSQSPECRGTVSLIHQVQSRQPLLRRKMMENIFQHGVASGDPLQDRVILWTRLTIPQQDSIELTWEIA
ncbi:MAG: PhoD-like phosphatase N-terminal domain-containing protein, partial [Chloroflexi bacterium]|nr:PhoD-like phosphatase N-terminal domain-containing protein [Chloroflexota bacterium]